MKTRKIINKVHMEAVGREEQCATANAWANQKKLKSSQPRPAPNNTPIHFGGVETGASLRPLGNHHMLPYKIAKDC